jgi:hypothetical protein
MGEKLNSDHNSDHKASKNIFLGAILIVLIFIIASYSGIMLYDNYKKDQLEYDFSVLNQQILLDDLYNTYLEDSNSQAEKCNVLFDQLESQISLNNELYKRLTVINNNNAIVETDNKLKYMYVLTNIKLWLHYKDIKENCDFNITGVLYFYPEIHESNPDKEKIDANTRVFQKKLQEFDRMCAYKSFALPYLKEIPILNRLIIDYNVTKAPAVVVGNKVIYDFPKYFDNDFLSKYNCEIDK